MLAPATAESKAAPPETGRRKWGSIRGRVWQVHVTLSREAAELLDQHLRPEESVASVIIRVLREASDRLRAESVGDDEPGDLFADPAPPGRRYRVPNGVRKHFDLTPRQRDGLSQYMEALGVENLSFVVSRAIMLVLGPESKGQPGKHPGGAPSRGK